METVRSLEKTLSDLYAKAPHLPKGFTQWLADNIWWLVVIGVAFTVLSLLALIPLTLVALGLSASVQMSIAPYANSAYDSGLGLYWLSALLSLAGLIVMVVLEAMAISPLKNKSKKGWTLLFIVALINLAFGVLSAIVTFNPTGVLFAVLWSGVWGYFLFEIHSYFAGKKVESKKAPAKS